MQSCVQTDVPGAGLFFVQLVSSYGYTDVLKKKSLWKIRFQFSKSFCKTPLHIPHYHVFRVRDESRN